MSNMRKIARSQMRAWAIGHLKTKQNGLCPLCLKPIELKVMGNKSDYVVDHNHETGEVRGVLHRSCNAAEGKVTNAAGQWGAKSNKYDDLIPWLERLIVYLKESGTGFMYSDHKTPEEKQEAARIKAKHAAAVRAAKKKMLERKESGV